MEGAEGAFGDAAAAGSGEHCDVAVRQRQSPRPEVYGRAAVEEGSIPYARLAADLLLAQVHPVRQRQQNLQVGCIRVGVHAAPKRLSLCVVR